ncbi:hypothetical protein [Mycobacterium sp.]|uniref:hypothetical protein n=1 Tax=Mycobacterium sp. TaxID=1785 RepID=UPI003A89975C
MADTLSRLTDRPSRTAVFKRPLDPADAVKVDELRGVEQKAQSRLTALKLRADKRPDDRRIDEEIFEADQNVAEASKAVADALESTVTFSIHLQSVPPVVIERIVNENEPTKEQRAKARAANGGDPKAEPAFNPETFPMALIAAAVTKIEISDGQSDPITSITADSVRDMIRGWPQGDQESLFVLVEKISLIGTGVEGLGKD